MRRGGLEGSDRISRSCWADEWRRGQLQRTWRPGLTSIGAFSRKGHRNVERASPSSPTASRSSRTTTLASLFDAPSRRANILVDWSRGVWGCEPGLLRSNLTQAGEKSVHRRCRTRSNPIDFENASNLEPGQLLLRHLSEKLPISRWQPDLTDSTVLHPTWAWHWVTPCWLSNR